MKIAICGDVHFSTYSSILRSRGDKYSKRLENCIKSVSWFETLSAKNHCELEVFLGDFFDKPILTSEEITAVSSISWNSTPKYILVGNHEIESHTTEKSSTHMLFNIPNCEIINSVQIKYGLGGQGMLFIPYILESDRLNFTEYINGDSNRIVFSHNDLKGIQMGQFLSKEGFDIDEINNNCHMFFDGHLHNGGFITPKILNVGNLTGQNFSEDADKYTHGVVIYDTVTDKYEFYENPYAYNFYKLVFTPGMQNFKLKDNAVVTVKVMDVDVAEVREIIKKNPNICESKLIIQNGVVADTDDISSMELNVDHLSEFVKFIKLNMNNTETLMEELTAIMEG